MKIGDKVVELIYEFIYGSVSKKRLTEAFTEKEKSFLSILNKRWRWIAKDEDGIVCVFEQKPWKADNRWDYNLESDMFFTDGFDPELTFNFISWEDPEPTNLDELRELL